MASSRGFSLIELVVTMLIVGILAAIAIPGYNNYVRKSHRTDAKTALLDMASLEERYFSTQNTYSSNPSDLGYTGTLPLTVGNGYYQVTAINVTAATAPTALLPGGSPATYNIVAVPINDQVKDLLCTSFTIFSSGQQTALGSDPSPSQDCWH